VIRPLLLIALLVLSSAPARATLVLDFSNGPVVFDFEDGMQGWELFDGAERVQTDALGGSWAIQVSWGGIDILESIFFLRIAGPRLDVDLSNVDRVELRYHGDVTKVGCCPVLAGLDIIEDIFIGTVDLHEMALDPELGQASVRVADLPPDPVDVAGFERSLGFLVTAAPFALIDDITFYPSVPEPGTLMLVSVCLLGLVATRSRH
jgi:hypothetical protein